MNKLSPLTAAAATSSNTFTEVWAVLNKARRIRVGKGRPVNMDSDDTSGGLGVRSRFSSYKRARH